MAELLTAAKAVDALWDEPDPGSGDNIWMTEDEAAMASALRSLRAAIEGTRDAAPGLREALTELLRGIGLDPAALDGLDLQEVADATRRFRERFDHE